MDCSPWGSSVHGISQARKLECVDISFSRGSSWPRDWTHIACITGRFFTVESPGKHVWSWEGDRRMFYTHTHTHTYKKRWCEDAGRELKQRSHKPKNAGKCQTMEGKLRMDHLTHGWRKSWCEGARDGEMTKEIVPKSSKETFEEKKIIDEQGRQKQEAGSWICKGKMVWWADFETGQMPGKSHNWDALHYMFLEVFSETLLLLKTKTHIINSKIKFMSF